MGYYEKKMKDCDLLGTFETCCQDCDVNILCVCVKLIDPSKRAINNTCLI